VRTSADRDCMRRQFVRASRNRVTTHANSIRVCSYKETMHAISIGVRSHEETMRANSIQLFGDGDGDGSGAQLKGSRMFELVAGFFSAGGGVAAVAGLVGWEEEGSAWWAGVRGDITTGRAVSSPAAILRGMVTGL